MKNVDYAHSIAARIHAALADANIPHMLSNLDTLRAATRLANCRSSLHPVDGDLAAEAGMDAGLGRLLQAARDLDRWRDDAGDVVAADDTGFSIDDTEGIVSMARKMKALS